METTSVIQEEKTPTIIIGFFDNEEKSEEAYQILTELEYPPVSITLAVAEETYKEKYGHQISQNQTPHADAQGGPNTGEESSSTPKTTKAAEGVALGTTAGASLGALAFLGASLVVPGVAIIGPLAAALTGAGAGATVGGLTGLLFGFGHPENEESRYRELLATGKYMIRISPKSSEDAKIIVRNWESLGGNVEVHY